MEKAVTALLDRLEHAVPKSTEPQREQTCRICGCTWDHGCPGGCWWVEPDLCSACVGAAYPEDCHEKETTD